MRTSKVTIADIEGIADRAGVSKATVSRVLNRPASVKETKRDAVKQAMKEMGFKPNQFAPSLANGQSNTIGFVTQNIGTSFFDSIARSIIQELRQTSYAPIFSDGMYQQDAVNLEKGYRKAHLEAGIKVDEELTYPGKFHGQSGVLAVESWLMRGNSFSALRIAADELHAFDTMVV